MRIITLFFFSLLVSGIIAQSSENDKKWVVGGSFSFQTSTTDDGNDEVESSSFSVSPYLGYQLSDKALIGVRTQYSSDNTMLTSDIEASSSLFGFSAFLRYNLAQGARWATFIEPEVAFLTGSSESNIGFGDSESDLSGFAIGAGLGGYYEISDSWRALIRVGGLSYASVTETDEDDNEETTSGLNLNLGLVGLSFGLEYKF